MSCAAPDAILLDVAPITTDATLYALDCSAVDAAITLPTGGYQVQNAGSTLAVIRLGAVASVPTTGTSLEDAGVLPGGAAVTVHLRVETSVHVILASGTGTLYFVRVS